MAADLSDSDGHAVVIEKCSDDSDRATAIEEAERESVINAVRKEAGRSTLLPFGACYFCGEAVTSKQLFCDSDCAADYEREQAQRRRARS